MYNELQSRLIKSTSKNTSGNVYLKQIDYIHDKVHQGKMLFSGDVFTVLNGGVIYIHHISGNTKYLHSFVSVESVGEWRFTSYGGTTYTDNGTEIVQINRKSDSTYVPEVKFYENLAGDIDVLGSQRLDFSFGSGTNPAKSGSGTLGERIETVFQPNLDILIKLVNNSGATQTLTVLYNYYEEE